MKNSISVIIPAFNAGRTLARAIESVLNQSHAAYEIIVVDDGSTDDTRNIIESYEHHVISIYQQNQGCAAARQRGTEAVSAAYIAYLDADDFWPLTKLELLEQIIEDHNPEFVFSDFNRAELHGNKLSYLPKNSTFYPDALKEIKNLPESNKFKNLYSIPQELSLALIQSGFPAYPSTILVRKTSQIEAGGWDKRFNRSQDFDFNLRMAQRYGMLYFNEIITTIGLHDVNNDLHRYVEMQTKGDILVLTAHIGSASSKQYKRQCQIALAQKWIRLANTQLSLGKKRQAIQSLFRAFLLPRKKLSVLYNCYKIVINP